MGKDQTPDRPIAAPDRSDIGVLNRLFLTSLVPRTPNCFSPHPGDERRELPPQAEPLRAENEGALTLTPLDQGGPQPLPRAKPSCGLHGQAPASPVVHFYAAQVAYFYAVVDTSLCVGVGPGK